MFAWRDNFMGYSGVTTDPYWTSVSLLNTYQNNLGFVDSSTNNFILTTFGSIRTATRTPFSTGGSLYFNSATSDYMTLPASNAAFTLGTGAFTIEFWVYMSAISGSQAFIDMRLGGYNSLGILIYLNGTTLTFYTNGAAQITSVGSVSATTWTQIALARSGTSTKLFVNGTQVGSTYTDSNSYIANTPNIGRFYDNSGAYITGFMTNFRIVKGTAVYTSNFTPPTTPLTAISGTSVLLLATNQGMLTNAQFIDTGPNSFTVTPTNTPLYSGLSPFTNTYPGSISLTSASSQYLTVATNAAFTYGTGDFTIECWVNFKTVGGGVNRFIIDQRNSGTANAAIPTILLSSTSVIVYYTTGNARITGGTTLTTGIWYHVAVCRSGTTTNLFVNGTQEGVSYTDTNNYVASRVVIGSEADSISNYLNGYISNIRLTKGYAYYTSNFTPSTVPLTSSTTYTSLLITSEEGAFYDLSTSGQLMTNTSTNAQTSVQQSKFSTQSVTLTPTGYLTVTNASNLQFGTNDFTIEGYLYRNITSVTQTVMSKGATTPTGWMTQINTIAPYNSLSFNGTSQFMYTKPSGTEFNMSTGNFTVELWVYPTSAAINIYAPTIFTMNSNGDWAVGGTGCRLSTQTLILGGSPLVTITFSSVIPLNAWTFVSIVRNGSGSNNVTCYHNGVSKGTGTYTGGVGSNTAWPAIGASDSAPTGREFMGGYYTDLRIVKGVAVRTAAFTPPTVPLTAITGTSLLVFQSYVDSGPYALTLYTTGSPGVFNITPYGTSTDSLSWYSSNTKIATSTTSLAATTWYYFAIVRSGTTVYLFINGTLEATGTDNTNYNQTNNLLIGCDRSNINGFNGFLDNIRITTGVARYTTTFTPPTTTFPTS